MRRKHFWMALTLAATAAAFAGIMPSAAAQQGNTNEGSRKVKSRIVPVYPELAKRMNVTGKVKVEVVIAPDGRVRSTRVIGGHPLLVNPAVDAVKEWRFYPAAEETTQIVEFEFKGASN